MAYADAAFKGGCFVRSSRPRSVPGRASVALAQNRFHQPPEPPDRTAAPVGCDGGSLGTVERGDPAAVESAFADQIGGDGRQQGVEIGGRRFRESDDAEAIADRGRQRIEAVGGGDIADLAEVEGDLSQERLFWAAALSAECIEAGDVAADDQLIDLRGSVGNRQHP